MGRGCRQKGARGELSLVYHLRKLDYDARRVICTRQVSGLEQQIVPDVIATKDGQEYKFEVKLRATKFKKLYELLGATNATQRVLVDGVAIAFGKDFEDVKNITDQYFPLVIGDVAKRYRKLLKFRAWLKGADFLAVRGNNKPFVFLRYWG